MEANAIVYPGDDETPGKTVIETDWGVTINVTGNATVITGQVQNFLIGGMPGQGKSGVVRWQTVQATPVDDEPDLSDGDE